MRTLETKDPAIPSDVDDVDDAESSSLRQRLEASEAGRGILSGLIVILLLSLLASNLPPSELKRVLRERTEPVLDTTGLHQRWNLFAPNPRQSTLSLVATLTYADGSVVEWRPPDGDPIVGAYRSYRWRKWSGYVVSERRGVPLWPQTSQWIAEQNRREGQRPVEVVLALHHYRAPRPGSGETERPPWRTTVLHTARYEEA